MEVRLAPLVVGDPEAAACVEITEPNPRVRKLAPELPRARCGREDRFGVEQLRADVERDADGVQGIIGRCPQQCLLRLGAFQTELALSSSGGEVFVPAAGYIRVQPYRDSYRAPARSRDSNFV